MEKVLVLANCGPRKKIFLLGSLDEEETVG
jgi:hypothetical protein